MFRLDVNNRMTVVESMSTDVSIVRRREKLESQMATSDFDAAFRGLRGVHSIARSRLLTARERIIAVVGAAQGEPVVGGTAASIVHGTAWYDADFDVELIRGPTGSGRAAVSTSARRLDLAASDVVVVDGIRVTSPVRTAFDLLRVRPPWRALGYVDMLARATPIDPRELADYADDQRRVRYVRQARDLARLVDARSESPPESWVRYLMFTADLPTPDLQIEVRDRRGVVFARIDLGYEALKIGIEYDGEEFHSSPSQQSADSQRDQALFDLGWLMIRVRGSRLRQNPFGVVVEIDKALKSRGGY
ncbi:hypothetical protein GS4_14_01280 [Gordonia soli NBRC 108243]|uniref:Restriction endonuclease type II-like domain-containing protein n=2 Tax=Gordonia soli TaxID=320799 RepID=M0QJ28_9ACTN|nr:hypothetical protein GS4_14_01280 [Gordonia soli NBRC 108243]